jgi:predicted RNA-binding Zn-ribbon protein involved in translation (DUF1610 family)
MSKSKTAAVQSGMIAMLTVTCPACQKILGPEAAAGPFQCPNCGNTLDSFCASASLASSGKPPFKIQKASNQPAIAIHRLQAKTNRAAPTGTRIPFLLGFAVGFLQFLIFAILIAKTQEELLFYLLVTPVVGCCVGFSVQIMVVLTKGNFYSPNPHDNAVLAAWVVYCVVFVSTMLATVPKEQSLDGIGLARLEEITPADWLNWLFLGSILGHLAGVVLSVLCSFLVHYRSNRAIGDAWAKIPVNDRAMDDEELRSMIEPNHSTTDQIQHRIPEKGP